MRRLANFALKLPACVELLLFSIQWSYFLKAVILTIGRRFNVTTFLYIDASVHETAYKQYI